MSALLERICEEINTRINYHGELPYRDDLINTLNSLDITEKCYIGEKFCNYEWNVGSIRMLSILQECHILSATNYLLCQDDEQHIQFVLYDFLEGEYNLLQNLFEHYLYSSKNTIRLKLYLENCFEQLIHDAINNPQIVNVKYLIEFKKITSERIYHEIISMHLNALIKMNNTNIKKCFENMKDWRKQIHKNETILKLIDELVKDPLYQCYVFEKLLKISSVPNFKGWKYFLLILERISKNFTTDSVQIIKKYLKDLFKSFISKNDKDLCFVMFMVARFVYDNGKGNANNNQNSETYSSWFKNTIGNMKYVIDIQSFKYVMSVLEEMIDIENDPVYIQIHINTAINPPVHCNDIVLNYKKKCKQQVFNLKQNDNPEEESIIIDDDD